MVHTILLVDDEAVLLETLSYNLEHEGYRVLTARDGQSALEVVERDHPDLVILDLMLPKLDGIDVCRRLRQRERTATVPILMLTARGDEVDKVIGLEVGADDYVTKPFGRREVLARVRSLLRRATSPERVHSSPAVAEPPASRASGREIEAGPLRIDVAGRLVLCRGKSLDMQPKQFDLLLYLVQNKGTVLTRDVLLSHVWGYDYLGDTRTVDVHIRWLREKVEQDPANPHLIQTVRGVGYVFR